MFSGPDEIIMTTAEKPKVGSSFTKGTAEVYKLRQIKPGYGWADITIRSWTEGGAIDIQSDWGSYSYSWSSIGERSFKAFLLQVDYSYFMGKCISNHGQQFSPEKTIEKLKQDIFKARREDEIDKAVARDCYDALESNFDTHMNEGVFAERLWQTPIITEIYYSDPHNIEFITVDDYQAKAFWTEAWPKFCEIIKKEEA